MHIIIFGKYSPISEELVEVINTRGYSYELVDSQELDLNYFKSVSHLFENFIKPPNVIIFSSGYTNIELAEQEYYRALYSNTITPTIISDYAAKYNIKFVYYSSDHVIGNVTNIDEFSENDECKPINNYGMSKLMGEFAVKNSGCDYLIIRKSLVFTKANNNFIRKLLHKALKSEILHIPKNHLCSPTSGEYLAETTIRLIEQNCWNKIVHVGSSPCVSISDFSKYILELAKKQKHQLELILKDIVPVKSTIFGEHGFHGSLIPMKITDLFEQYGIKATNWKDILTNGDIDEYLKK